MSKEYSWSSAGFSGNAQKVGIELEKLELNGELTNEIILDYAEKHTDSELHKCFEWDDAEASRKFRLRQATDLLCSISVKIIEKPMKKQRVYYSVKSSDTKAKSYKNIKEIVKNDEEYNQLIDKASDDLNRCKEKYEELINKEDLKNIVFEIYRQI